MSLQLSEKFSLPKDAVLWTFAFLAIRGAGKTYDAAKLAEQILRLGYPIVVFDPMGIWWGLRVGIEGHEGFPVVIVGGQHQDIAIPLQSAKKGYSIVDEGKLREMVNGILQAGLSVVVDTSSLSSRTQQTRTVAFFADELFKRNAKFGIRHVFIEEADVYVPQKPLGETQASHTAIDNLVRRGGNFNLGCTMISQRSAVIDKDVLSQANCLVALRILYVRDKDAIREWVKNAVKNEREMKRLAKWYDSLKTLKNGEAWIYSPEHNDLFEKIQFGQRETLHASREYFLQETWQQKNITLRDVTAFVKAYKAKIEPKPMVPKMDTSGNQWKPSVLSPVDSGETRQKQGVTLNETKVEETSGSTIGGPIGTPTVPERQTIGETSSQRGSTTPTLDNVEMQLPTRQERPPMQVPVSGSVEGTRGEQYEPTLGQASDGSGTTTVDLDLIEVRYRIHHKEDEIVNLSTTTQEGKTMYVMLNDLGGQSSSFSQIKAALNERAWAISDNALAPTLGGLVKKGLLIAEGATKARTYRIPRKAKISVVNQR